MPLANLKSRLQRLDPFATGGVEPVQRQGMRNLWLDNVVASISGAFMIEYVSMYALALGASTAQIGALSSVSSLLAMLAPIPGAQLTERWGSRRRTVVSVWLVIRSLSLLLLAIPLFLTGDAAVLAVVALWALRAGLVNLAHPAWVSLSGDVIPTDRRGRFFSSRNIAMALTSMVFVPLAGQLIERGGAPRGYQWAFALSALFGFLALYFFQRIPEPEAEGPGQGRVARPRRLILHALVGNRTFFLYTLTAMLWNLSLQVGGPYFTVYQVKVLGTTPSIMGWLSMVMSLSTVIGQAVWGRVVDRRGSRWAQGLCALFIPILPMLWVFLRGPWDVIWIRMLSGFLWAGFNLSSFNLLLELPDPQQRTQATASYMTLIGIANIAGPIVGGLVVDRLGYLADFNLSGLGRLVAALLFVLLLKPFARPKTERV